MKNYRKHVDDFFREKLGRYRETPPADVWDDLEGKLDTLKPYVPKPPMRWVWHLSMVSLIAVLGVSLTRKFMSTPKESQPVAERTVATTQSSTAQAVTGAGEAEPAANNATAPDQGNVASINGSANGVSGTNNGAASEGNAGDNTENASTASSSVTSNGGANNTTSFAHVRSGKRHAAGSAKYSTQDILAAIEANKAAAAANNAARGVSVTSSGTSVFAAAHNNGKANIANMSAASKTTQNASAKTNNTSMTSLVRATEQSTVAAAEPEQATATSTQPRVNESAQTPANTDATRNTAEKAKAKQKDLAAVGNIKKQAEKEKAIQSDKPHVKHFDFGVKGGYEMGIGSQLASKWAVAPYVQYHLSSKFALMTQPGVKYATIAAHSVGAATSYYSVNQDGQVMQGPTTIGVRVIGANVDTFYSTKYTYRQSHDSIVKSKTYGGAYMEYEIPLLVQYSLNKELSVYGGVNLVYSQRMMVNEHTGTYSNIVRSVDTTITGVGAPGTPPALNDVITYTGNSFAEYHNTTYPMKVDNIFRMGYMVGMSYQYSQRWLFDAMLQQAPMKPDVRDGFNVNRTLSAPYVRLSVGYKISK